jgi:hypothetical protein
LKRFSGHHEGAPLRTVKDVLAAIPFLDHARNPVVDQNLISSDFIRFLFSAVLKWVYSFVVLGLTCPTQSAICSQVHSLVTQLESATGSCMDCPQGRQTAERETLRLLSLTL